MDPKRLTMADLAAYRGQGHGQRSGNRLRFYCPIHGGDRQRSFSLDPDTGLYKCHACGATGQLQEKRQEVQELRAYTRKRIGNKTATNRQQETGKIRGAEGHQIATKQTPEPAEIDGKIQAKLQAFQAALTADSWGGKYLARRGIPLDLAKRYGLGYAAEWLNPAADRAGRRRTGRKVVKWGRLVCPHTDTDSQVVNLYGRAIGANEKIPAENRHDHLAGPKGVFNGPALAGETVIITEGLFDALALMAAGHENVCAIFGVNGLRWEWTRAKQLVFAFDRDPAGQGQWRKLAETAILRGIAVSFVPADVYGEYKDLAELWQANGEIGLHVADPIAQQRQRETLALCMEAMRTWPAEKLQHILETESPESPYWQAARRLLNAGKIGGQDIV